MIIYNVIRKVIQQIGDFFFETALLTITKQTFPAIDVIARSVTEAPADDIYDRLKYIQYTPASFTADAANCVSHADVPKTLST